MDTSSPPSTTTLPPLPNTKLRLMCSYGGQIIPRADKKSLFYSCGETRIVAVDRRTTLTNLNSFMAHLSRTIFNNRPFILKYQIPSEDIDSLISVTSDEDLQNMIEEHERAVSCSSGPARIRLFLFPTKPESVGTVLLDPKSETWFNDALKSSMMIRGQSEDVGHGLLGFDGLGLGLLDSDGQGGEAVSNGGSGGGGEGKNGLMDFGSESMVLENNSSFGSTGSSTSMSTLPTIGAFGEEEKKKVTVVYSGSLDSDNSVASAVSHPKTGFHQDQMVHISSSDAKVFSNTVKPESIILEPSSLIQMKNAAQVSSYQLPPAPEEKLHQQVQYIHSGGHYVSQYPTDPLSFSSYYPVYQPQLHQQHVPYPPNPPNPPYPVYLLPMRPNQSYNMSASHNLNNATTAPSRPPLHPQTTLLSNQVAHREVTTAPVLPELTSDNYWNASPYIQKQQLLDPLESYQPSLAAVSDPLVTTNNDAEIVADDLAYAQIYKSQPPAPATTPPYETMTNATKVLLSESSTPLHGASLQSKRPNV